MDKPIDVLTFSDMAVDVIIDLGELQIEFGQHEQLARSSDVTMGGSCSIFAHQTALLGLSTSVVGRVGTDLFGRFLIDAHNAVGIDTERIVQDPDIRTSTSFCLCRDDDRAIVTTGESISALEYADVDWDLFSKARHLHIGSYFLITGLRDHWTEIIAAVRKNHGTVSLDTNWDPGQLWESALDLLPLVDVFFPNEQEAIGITGSATLEEAVRKLSDLLPFVVVKRGAAGADLYHGSTVLHYLPRTTDIYRDSIGAGDSFAAGFVSGFLRNRPFEECLRIGGICGSRSVSMPGGTRGQPTARGVAEALAFDAARTATGEV